MKLVFMGTPDFAVCSLRALAASGYEVATVITQPDKPKGRGYQLAPPPVKEYALSQGLPVYQPTSMRDGEAAMLLREIAPDVCVVVAYGKILPQEVLDIPRFGCINVHASLLPRYRGASPIQWSIVCGEEKTGVTTMKMDAGMDTGDILCQAETAIAADDTAETLSGRLASMGGELLLETLQKLKDGTLQPKPQADASATYAPIIKKSDGRIDWTRPAKEIDCKIRGLHAWPAAHTICARKLLKIYAATVLPTCAGTPGEILAGDKELIVACGEGALRVEELQLEGGKRMAAADFLRGRKLNVPALG